jgi:hypothetical protein
VIGLELAGTAGVLRDTNAGFLAVEQRRRLDFVLALRRRQPLPDDVDDVDETRDRIATHLHANREIGIGSIPELPHVEKGLVILGEQ